MLKTVTSGWIKVINPPLRFTQQIYRRALTRKLLFSVSSFIAMAKNDSTNQLIYLRQCFYFKCVIRMIPKGCLFTNQYITIIIFDQMSVQVAVQSVLF